VKSNIQLKYSNYVAFSHFHGYAVNNPGLEYLKQEVRIVFAFVIYFAIKIGLFFIDRLCGVQKEKMQYHGMKAVYDEKG